MKVYIIKVLKIENFDIFKKCLLNLELLKSV